MLTTRLLLSASLVILAGSQALAGPQLSRQLKNKRVKTAYAKHLTELEQDFRAAKAAWPPKSIYIRAFKDEDLIELWASPHKKHEAWRLVKRFPICARSGTLGPKLKEGDGQVPEGFYVINRFNPNSSYHLSLGINYPHRADRALSRARDVKPGSDIFIHGDCVTIGCLPIENEPMERLYLAALLARDQGQAKIPVHIFPCRLHQRSCEEKLGEYSDSKPDFAQFWASLRAGYDAFEHAHKPPRIKALSTGAYRVTPKP